MLTPLNRSALGWNQACLSSYINYALNTRTNLYAVLETMDIKLGLGKRTGSESNERCATDATSLSIVKTDCVRKSVLFSHEMCYWTLRLRISMHACVYIYAYIYYNMGEYVLHFFHVLFFLFY